MNNRLELRLEVTNACNAKCLMCPREQMTRDVGVMPMGLFKKIVKNASCLGYKYVSLENYGEPFLDPHLAERAELVRDLGFTVMTITNGSKILTNIRTAQLFHKIRISLSAHTKATFEKVEPGISYEDVIAGLEKLLSLARRPIIELSWVLLAENKHEVDEWFDFWRGRVDKVSVWKPHNWIIGREYREPRGPRTSCLRPKNGPLQVHWDGKVVPCTFDFDSHLVIGDLNSQTIEEVLEGDKCRNLIAAHDRREFPFPCAVCDQTWEHNDACVMSTAEDVDMKALNTFGLKLER